MTRPGLERLSEEARYARERFRLYRARIHGSRPVSLRRLRDLERALEAAEARFRHAQVSKPSAR